MIDENIPLMSVRALRRLGHDVCDVRGTPQEGAVDQAIWEMAQREKRALATTDKGFARYRDEAHYGILIICLRKPNRHRIHQRVMQAIAEFAPEDWPGLLVVMRDNVRTVWRAPGGV